MIAFTSPDQDVLRVFDTVTATVVDTDAGASAGTDYACSPGSRELLYRKQRSEDRGDGYEVWRHDFATGAHEQVLSVGGPLRLVIDGSTGDLLLTNAKGGLKRRTPGPGTAKAVKPVAALRGQVVVLEEGEVPVVLSDPDERCFDLQPAPSGDVFVYSDMDTLKLRRRSGELVGDLGFGLHARWSPDGSCLVYQVTHDDGHRITMSDLAVGSPDGVRRARLTASAAYDEVEPCWTPDGRALVCVCEKTGHLLKIHLTRFPE